jgi:hypothetical protein
MSNKQQGHGSQNTTSRNSSNKQHNSNGSDSKK